MLALLSRHFMRAVPATLALLIGGPPTLAQTPPPIKVGFLLIDSGPFASQCKLP